MAVIPTTKQFEKNNRVFKKRLYFLLLGVLLSVSLISYHLFNLQISSSNHYKTLADKNRLRLMAIEPPRGIIYDRNHNAIAHNQPLYQLTIVPRLVDNMEQTLQDLKNIIDLSDHNIKRFKKTLQYSPPSRSIVLQKNLSHTEVAHFASEQYRFPGVEITATLGRYYPDHDLFAHAVGYIGRIDREDMKQLNKKEYRSDQYIGKVGIEKQYEKLLHGKTGLRKVEINAQGHIIRVIDEQGAQPGGDIMLSLDYELQHIAAQSLGEHLGAVVALDPGNGDILALVSKPSYDANLFSNQFDDGHYKENILQNSSRPMFNRALNGQYPPGSTIKPVIALAGLENHTTSADAYLYAGPYYITPNFTRRFYDWREQGHGLVNLHTSIVQSCDIFFYDLAYRTGIDRLATTLKKFGIGQAIKLNLSYETTGILPSRAWKKAYYGDPWLPEETVITGVGQGYMLATPLQLAVTTAMLANRGYPVQPRIVKAVRPHMHASWNETPISVGKRIDIKEQHWAIIDDAMMDVVHSPNGTAYGISHGLSYMMAGKTGTAQVYSRKEDEALTRDQSKLDKSLRDHALFIAYAPLEKPTIAIAVIVENVGSGSRYAAPIARKVLDSYFAKQGDVARDI